MMVRPTLLPMFVLTSNSNMLWSPFSTETSLRMLSLPKVTEEFRLCSEVTGTVAMTLLLLPFESKFLSASTELHATVTYCKPRFTSTWEGEFVHAFGCMTLFTGKPNKGPKFRRFNCFAERILHVLSCLLRSNWTLLSPSLSLIMLNDQYLSPNVIGSMFTPPVMVLMLSLAPFRTFLNSQ